MSCLFCRIVEREVPAKIAYEDDEILAFHDVAPQAPVHVLVIPRQHVATISDVPADGPAPSMAHLFAGVARTAHALGLSSAGGYRVVVNCGERAGQSVWHVHVHLLAGRSFAWPPG